MGQQQVTVSGQLVAGPASSSGDTTFPAAVTNITFGLTPSSRPVSVDTGAMRPNVASASAFVALPGIGADGPVTRATFLYFRSATPFTLRKSTFDPDAPNTPVVAVETVKGIYVVEFDDAHYLTLLEAKGSGQIEYYAAGPQ